MDSPEELFDVCDPHGRPTGLCVPRSEVHRRGLWHRSAHLWVIDSQFRVLLQRRHPDKQTDPGRWDISCAGHVSAGQTPVQAMIREAHEELGLNLEPGELIALSERRKEYLDESFGGAPFADREFQSVFLVRRDLEVADLVLQESEVIDARWEDSAVLRGRIEAADPSLVDRRGEWQEVYRFVGLFR